MSIDDQKVRSDFEAHSVFYTEKMEVEGRRIMEEGELRIIILSVFIVNVCFLCHSIPYSSCLANIF